MPTFADDWEVASFSPVESHNGIITTIDSYQTITMWHYSGGYWGGDIITIPDTVAFKDADALAAALNQTVTFDIDIPDEVKTEIEQGHKVIISCDTSDPEVQADNLFYADGNGKGTPTFSFSGDTLHFQGYPKLNFMTGVEYKDYVYSLNKYIPIVNPIYGKNRYAIWTRSGVHLGAADGFIDANDPAALGPAGTIHPSQITNSKGHLQSGFKVYVDHENSGFDWYDSAEISVGSGTFQDAGAVAMRFEYPLRITFYRVDQGEPEESPPPDIPDSVDCGEALTWTERDSHQIPNGSGGVRTCNHTFTYETTLSTTHAITPKAFKSGYGFAATVNAGISTRRVANSGGCTAWGSNRNPDKTPVPPTKADVRLPWKVSNSLGTQPYVVSLDKISSTSITSQFEPAPNPISEISAKQIYTEVALKGTADAPFTHEFEIYVSGGGVNDVAFCKVIPESVTINGDMYTDDISGAN